MSTVGLILQDIERKQKLARISAADSNSAPKSLKRCVRETCSEWQKTRKIGHANVSGLLRYHWICDPTREESYKREPVATYTIQDTKVSDNDENAAKDDGALENTTYEVSDAVEVPYFKVPRLAPNSKMLVRSLHQQYPPDLAEVLDSVRRAVAYALSTESQSIPLDDPFVQKHTDPVTRQRISAEQAERRERLEQYASLDSKESMMELLTGNARIALNARLKVQWLAAVTRKLKRLHRRYKGNRSPTDGLVNMIRKYEDIIRFCAGSEEAGRILDKIDEAIPNVKREKIDDDEFAALDDGSADITEYFV